MTKSEAILYELMAHKYDNLKQQDDAIKCALQEICNLGVQAEYKCQYCREPVTKEGIHIDKEDLK